MPQPQQINPQVDVGGLTLRGLSAFSSILATLSTDGVTPVAMLQLEKLGTYFPVNGPKSAKVSDLLQRCNSVRLDRLALAIGWRKGDSASLMSESAGGQAISLLCACIFSIFDAEDSSTILSYLCMRLLPPGETCASMPQLYDVGKILSTKLEPLGFGTFLAEQTIRVCRVYEQMDTNIPNGFLDRFSLDAAVDMLCSISRAARDSDIMVRIVGISGAGYIISYVLTLFPGDCLIMVEGVIINSSERQKIVIEISSTADLAGPTQIFVEEILPHKVAVALPIETTHLRSGWRFGSFQWQRHIGDQLDLTFINMGLPGCSSEILVASCDLVFSLPCWTEDIFSPYRGDPFPEGGLIALLGSEPWYRIQKVLTEVVGTSPSLPRKSLEDAWSAFLEVVGNAISVVSCTCNRCTPEGSWGKPSPIKVQ